MIGRMTAGLLGALLLGWSAVATAQTTFVIQPGMTGSWFDRTQAGHGILIEVLDDERIWVCWFTFDADGNRTWICGLGTINGNQATVPAFQVEGGLFPPLFDPDNTEIVDWGTFTFTFFDCNNALFAWAPLLPGFQAGSMPLERLTIISALPCQDIPTEPVINIPRVTGTVTVDGVFAAGEWDNADSVTYNINPDWQVTVYFQTNGAQLFFAFDGMAGPGGINRVPVARPDTLFPELFIDVTPDDTDQFDASNHWFHMSFQDCYAVGFFATAANCNFILGGWTANNWPLPQNSEIIEVAIGYGRLGLEPNQPHPIRLLATMTSSLVGNSVYHNWPVGSGPGLPATWHRMMIE